MPKKLKKIEISWNQNSANKLLEIIKQNYTDLVENEIISKIANKIARGEGIISLERSMPKKNSIIQRIKEWLDVKVDKINFILLQEVLYALEYYDIFDLGLLSSRQIDEIQEQVHVDDNFLKSMCGQWVLFCQETKIDNKEEFQDIYSVEFLCYLGVNATIKCQLHRFKQLEGSGKEERDRQLENNIFRGDLFVMGRQSIVAAHLFRKNEFDITDYISLIIPYALRSYLFGSASFITYPGQEIAATPIFLIKKRKIENYENKAKIIRQNFQTTIDQLKRENKFRNNDYSGLRMKWHDIQDNWELVN